MSTGSNSRTRAARVATVKLPPGRLARRWQAFQRRESLVLVLLGVLGALAIWAAVVPWTPPFPFHTGDVPQRDIVARYTFTVLDNDQTLAARRVAMQQAQAVYRQDPAPLVQLRSKLVNTVVEICGAATLQDLDMDVWRQFQPPLPPGAMAPTREEEEERFSRFRAAFTGPGQPDHFAAALADVFRPLEQRGLLEKLQHTVGDQQVILVYQADKPGNLASVKVADVLLGLQAADYSELRQRLDQNAVTAPVADHLYAWLRHRLVETLQHDAAASAQVAQDAARAVPPVQVSIVAGQKLASGGQPLGPVEMELLRQEYLAGLKSSFSSRDTWYRALALLAIVGLLFVLCASYMAYREPRLLQNRWQLVMVLALAALCTGLARLLFVEPWQATVVPLLFFGLTIAVAYSRALGVLLTVSLLVVVTLSLGKNVGWLLTLGGALVTGIMQTTVIHSRLRLIEVCLTTALVAAVLTLALELVQSRAPDRYLLQSAGMLAFWTLVTGFLVTGVLPLVEKAFGVLTDLSLRELGDASHPLLQELHRRAPGTYSHSLNVASLAEAAAQAIGARGLLVRVGAYFHDIGKMLKPEYFVENQGDNNRHETLVPAMSTLIIIAHIKDGADLARSRRLPEAIVDFILQHHGTTLVQYFYQRASQQAGEDEEVEETSFRYPGPKPQTREAAVLMLADAVEGASRSLEEPTASRIENLVNQLALNRLMDGQFDESGITLQELRIVQDSLIKSLIAMHHARVKYPASQTQTA